MINSFLTNRRNIALATLLLSPFLLITAHQSTTDATKPKLPKTSCRIEIDDAHISTSIQKRRGINVVKVNARSICNVRQD